MKQYFNLSSFSILTLLILWCISIGNIEAQTTPDGVFPKRPYGDSLRAVSPPNIIVLIVDDLGWADVNYSPMYKTPNIDRLMAESATFTNAYSASPSCSPSRASFLTGRNPARFLLVRHIPSVPKFGFDSYGRPTREFNFWPTDPAHMPSRNWLPLSETTFAEALGALGYHSIFIGKWHLGHAPYYPIHQGFDVQQGVTNFGHPKSYTAPYFGGRTKAFPDIPKGTYLTDQLTEYALNFIKTSSNHKQQPFLLTLFYYAIHAPFDGPEKLVKKFMDNGLKKNVAERAAMFAKVDQSIGRIREALKNMDLLATPLLFLGATKEGLCQTIHCGEESLQALPYMKGEHGFRLLSIGPEWRSRAAVFPCLSHLMIYFRHSCR